MSLLSEVLTGGIRGGTSIEYAALGESVSERAGVVNLGTEGSMLMGALAAYAVASRSGHPWLGVLGAAIAGGLLALVHAYFVLSRKANQLATGLVVLFLGLGLTSLFGVDYVQALAPTFRPIALPGLSRIPFLGGIAFKQDPLVYMSYVTVPVMWWFIFRSRWGVLLRAAGERSEVLTTHGHRVIPIQYISVVVGGMFAGIGGAHLSIAYTKSWFENMTQGRGFVAVAVVMFAARQPFKVAAGAYLFGAALALSPALQARGYGINQFALDAIPYVVTILVLVALGKRRSGEIPEGLSKVFEAPTLG
ncbi:MAG: inner-rane translocator [Acidimicrobiales bacterium]|nr:inner-rane translocator [Acidimicrobiales bacterium]